MASRILEDKICVLGLGLDGPVLGLGLVGAGLGILAFKTSLLNIQESWCDTANSEPNFKVRID